MDGYKIVRIIVRNETSSFKDVDIFSDKNKKGTSVEVETEHADFMVKENREDLKCFMVRVEKYSHGTKKSNFGKTKIVAEKTKGSADHNFTLADFNDFKAQELIVDVPMNDISFKDFPELNISVAPNSIYELVLFTKK